LTRCAVRVLPSAPSRTRLPHSPCSPCLPFFFFLMIPPPPRSTLFPYTTLFRSVMTPPRPHSRAPATVCSSSSWSGQTVSMVGPRSEEHTSELQSRFDLVCRLLLEKKKEKTDPTLHLKQCRPKLRQARTHTRQMR